MHKEAGSICMTLSSTVKHWCGPCPCADAAAVEDLVHARRGDQSLLRLLVSESKRRTASHPACAHRPWDEHGVTLQWRVCPCMHRWRTVPPAGLCCTHVPWPVGHDHPTCRCARAKERARFTVHAHGWKRCGSSPLLTRGRGKSHWWPVRPRTPPVHRGVALYRCWRRVRV